jgi:hypothetical protein
MRNLNPEELKQVYGGGGTPCAPEHKHHSKSKSKSKSNSKSKSKSGH